MARMFMAHAEPADFAAVVRPAEALLDLGLRYCAGRETAPDLVEAHKWFNLAAMRGSEEAKRLRLEISREMTAGEISAAQREARAWLAEH